MHAGGRVASLVSRRPVGARGHRGKLSERRYPKFPPSKDDAVHTVELELHLFAQQQGTDGSHKEARHNVRYAVGETKEDPGGPNSIELKYGGNDVENETRNTASIKISVKASD